MTEQVVTASQSTNLLDAAKTMGQQHIGSLIILEATPQGERIIEILSRFIKKSCEG